MSEALTYGRYLKLDETLFIIIHQVYELWFKEMLHEIDHACLLMDRGDRPRVLHTLK